MRLLAGWLGLALWVSPAAAPGDRDLEEVVDQVLARKELRETSVGIEVRHVHGRYEVLSRSATEPFIPASNQKLLTLASALHHLGVGFSFETPLLTAAGLTEKGVLEGDLWIRGSGDPTLAARFFEKEDAASPLEPFVEALLYRGIRRVRGDLVLDDRAFDGQTLGPGWPRDQLEQDYCAPVSALSLNGNCLDVWVQGTLVSMRPEAEGYRLVSELSESAQPKDLRVWLSRPDPERQVFVRGRVGPEVESAQLVVPVTDPTWFFGAALLSACRRAGVEFEGVLRRASEEESPGATSRALYTRRSPLLPSLYVCGKESDNMIAEHLWKACAVRRGMQGSFAAGASACEEFLREIGADLQGTRRVDGSGLSRDNRVTPELMVDVLVEMYHSEHRDEFLRSLPISGVDGTLRKRLKEPAMLYRLRAKTGYLHSVSCLSGYLMAGTAENPDVYAFAILMNGFQHGDLQKMQRAQDDLCRALASLKP